MEESTSPKKKKKKERDRDYTKEDEARKERQRVKKEERKEKARLKHKRLMHDKATGALKEKKRAKAEAKKIRRAKKAGDPRNTEKKQDKYNREKAKREEKRKARQQQEDERKEYEGLVQAREENQASTHAQPSAQCKIDTNEDATSGDSPAQPIEISSREVTSSSDSESEGREVDSTPPKKSQSIPISQTRGDSMQANAVTSALDSVRASEAPKEPTQGKPESPKKDSLQKKAKKPSEIKSESPEQTHPEKKRKRDSDHPDDPSKKKKKKNTESAENPQKVVEGQISGDTQSAHTSRGMNGIQPPSEDTETKGKKKNKKQKTISADSTQEMNGHHISDNPQHEGSFQSVDGIQHATADIETTPKKKKKKKSASVEMQMMTDNQASSDTQSAHAPQATDSVQLPPQNTETTRKKKKKKTTSADIQEYDDPISGDSQPVLTSQTIDGIQHPPEDAHTTMLKLTIEDASEMGPVILHTPGIDFTSDKPLIAHSQPRTQPANGAQQSQWSNELTLHSSVHPKLDYVAREESSGGAEAHVRSYIGVFDPETQGLKIIPARKLTMRATLKSEAREESSEESENEISQMSAFEQRKELSAAFGTKKSQKAMQNLEKNAIRSPIKIRKDANGMSIIDASTAAVIEAMEETSMPTRQELRAATNAAKPRPVPNIEANKAEDVYSLETLLGEDILQYIEINTWKDAVRDKVDLPTTSRFVSNRLVKVVKSKDVKKIKVLRLILSLVQWKHSLTKAPKNGFKLPNKKEERERLADIETPVLEWMKKKFAPRGFLDHWHTDYFFTHVCAFALTIDNFNTNVYDIREDLGLDLTTTTKYYRELGCRIERLNEKHRQDLKLNVATAAAQHRLAWMKIPPNFPGEKSLKPARRQRLREQGLLK